jgi:hypothetical protein
MAKTIAGFFRTRAEGETAEAALLNGGFARDRVSFVAGDTRGHDLPALGPVKDVEGDTELAKDAFLGSAIGLAVGMIAVFIPGVGPLIAAGPLGGAIAGLSVGAGAGGLVGLLKDHGVSEEEAEFYAEGVRRGGALITVEYSNPDEEKRARDLLREKGAIETEELSAELR